MHQLPSASLETLPRRLRTRDLFLYLIVAVFLFTNVPVVAMAGWASLLYWVLGFLMFLLPSALVAAQLFRLFPGDVGADLQKACARPWTVRAVRRIGRAARRENEADARVCELALID